MVLWPGRCERLVDPPQQERQRLAEMAKNDLQIGMLVKHAAQDQPKRVRRSLHGETPGGADQRRKVVHVFAVIGLDNGGMRH